MKERLEYDYTAAIVTTAITLFGLGKHPYMRLGEILVSNWIVMKDDSRHLSWIYADLEKMKVLKEKMPLAFADAIERKALLAGGYNCTQKDRNVAASRLCQLEGNLEREDNGESEDIRKEIYHLQNFVWSWDQTHVDFRTCYR